MQLKRHVSGERGIRPPSVGTFSTTSHHRDWLGETAAWFRSAITLRIPVGFEDETGFHQGSPQPMETIATRSGDGSSF